MINCDSSWLIYSFLLTYEIKNNLVTMIEVCLIDPISSLNCVVSDRVCRWKPRPDATGGQ